MLYLGAWPLGHCLGDGRRTGEWATAAQLCGDGGAAGGRAGAEAEGRTSGSRPAAETGRGGGGRGRGGGGRGRGRG